MGAAKNRRFNVYKIPVEILLAHAAIEGREPADGAWKFAFRLSSEETYRNEWAQAKADCILCTQLLKTKEERNGAAGQQDRAEEAQEEIWRDLIMINWAEASQLRKKCSYVYWAEKDKLVSISNDQLFFSLFRDGFFVEHGDQKVHYVRFERSANMSRQGVMSYIDERWKADLLERVTLGLCRDNSLDWLTGGISLSKWEAYKGLALSDAHCMDGCGFDVMRVAVIPDKEARTGAFPMGGYYTGAECGEQKPGTCRYGLIFKETEEKANINYFDGQGVIAPALAMAFEAKMYPGEAGSGRRSSFQIRMPFVKGVLHSVDFRTFLAEQGVDRIRDIFGREHAVAELDIILTKSQFKAYPWFKAMFGAAAWEEYQRRFRVYGHELFVTKANTLADERGGADFLNYQVIHSLGLSAAEFEELAEGSMAELARIKNDPKFGFDYICQQERPAGDETDAGYGAMARALKKDPTLLLTARFRAELQHYADMRKKDIQRGRLETKGSVRVFAGDLMMFLNHLLDQRMDAARAVRYEEPLATDAFYAPAFSGEADQCYGIFRNPHMARNEHAYMRHHVAAPGSARARFLGHLEGVLMVNPESMAAERMAGADYDGDLVNVVQDAVYARALKRRQSREDTALIVIPSPGTVTVDKTTKDLVKREYNLLQNQIGSKVGQYSYMAFCKAADAYGYAEGSADPEQAERAARARELIRDFTVQVGLEIDSVKSGRKPVISDDLWVSGFDYEPFLKSEKEENYEAVAEYKKWTQDLRQEGYEEFLVNHEREVKCNMNLLPLYVNQVAEERRKISAGEYAYIPELYPQLRAHFDTDVMVGGREVKADMKAALYAMDVLRRTWSAYRQEKARRKRYHKFETRMTKEQKKVREKMMDILFLQYEPEDAFFAMEQIEEWLTPTCFGCFGRKNLRGVLKTVKSSRFGMTISRARRGEKLWELLAPLQPRMQDGDERERFEAVFTNFDGRGAGLLTLALQFAACAPELPKEAGAEEAPEPIVVTDMSEETYQMRVEQGDDAWLQAYYGQILPHPSRREFLPRVKEEALRICERYHPEAAGDAAALEKLRMNYCLRLSADSSRKFLWAVCGDELERYVRPCIVPGINEEEGEES